ncbi:hypothetical protein [Mycolicibacterium nivoides]|uniref:hypothetical protein n=1 Tax=Mycolicibacterium nivoides TaxID=2487344 RepID=UPI000F5BE699|nr:hypothetical protein [Mycolicibacterium nivoides]
MSFPPQGPQPPYGQPPYGQPPYGQPPPHWPPSQGQPWQGQAWHGQAGAPPPYGQPPQWSPARPPIRPKKSGLAIAIVAVIAVVGISFVGFMGYEIVKVAGEGQDRVASSASDFSYVCENDRISNSAEYGKPYNVVAFFKGLGIVDEIWLPVAADKWTTSDQFSEINVVACLDRKKGSEVKSASCVDDDDGDHVTVDYYSVEYEVTFREAKTGTVIKSGGTVPGTAGSCPFIATYDRGSRKMYARPDEDAVQAKLGAFAG